MMTKELKKHWLLGEQMEGFLPCPFSGELPYINIKEYKPLASVSVEYTCYLVCEPFGIEIRSYATYSTQCGYTKEECIEKAIDEVKIRWNTRK